VIKYNTPNKLRSKFEIPGLTEETTIENSKKGMLISIIALLILTFSYLYFGVINNYESFIFFAVVTIIIFIYSIYVVFLFNGNLIITFRYLILLVPIFITSYVWWMYKGEVHTHYFGHEYQTLKATYIVVYGGILSVLGATMGWFFGVYKFRSNTQHSEEEKNIFYGYLQKNYKRILFVGVVGALFFGLAYLIISGGLISSKGGYSGHGQTINLNFSVYNVFQMFFMSLALIAVSFKKKGYKFIFLLLITSFVSGILAGSRADYLLPIIILFIIMIDGNMINSYYRPNFKIVFKRYFKVILLVFFGFFVSISFAIWRNAIDSSLLLIIFEHINNMSDKLFIDLGGHTIFWMETANHAIGGFYAFVQKIELGYIDYSYGGDYLNYIPRSLPSVIRPESLNMLDLAWHTDINGVRMTQGGVYEPAEAYANFGFLGCFFVSFIISFFFVWLLKKAKRDYSIFFMAWYIVNGFILSRAIWYQNFVFIRVATIMVFFYIIFYIFNQRWFFGFNPIFKKK